MYFTVLLLILSRYRYRHVPFPLPSRYHPVIIPLPSRYQPVTIPLPSRYCFWPPLLTVSHRSPTFFTVYDRLSFDVMDLFEISRRIIEEFKKNFSLNNPAFIFFLDLKKQVFNNFSTNLIKT